MPIKAGLGNPPKEYGRKVRRSLGLFILKHSGICEEIARVRVATQGDAYLIFMPSQGIDFHESFHRSGEFHWCWNDEKKYPLCGILDLPMAVRFKLSMSPPPCICIRADNKRLSREEIAFGLRVLLRLVPIDVNPNDIDKYAEIIKEQGFIRFILSATHLDSHYIAISWSPKHHIDTIRKLFEGTKFEKDVITLDEILKKLKKQA